MKKVDFGVGVSRRAFLAAGAGFGLFNIVPSSVLGADAPSGKVTMALVGAGGMGNGNMRSFLAFPDVRFLAVCDVNRAKRERAKEMVDNCYGNGDCAMYRDFRDVCMRDDIDAVIVATPDHWHAVIGIYAANCGKDIYGEKPFSHDLREGRALVRAVERNGRVWQTGSWQRSRGEMQHAVELVKNGCIGKIARVEVGLPSGGRGPAATPGAFRARWRLPAMRADCRFRFRLACSPERTAICSWRMTARGLFRRGMRSRRFYAFRAYGAYRIRSPRCRR